MRNFDLRLLLLLALFTISLSVKAQARYGTTGLICMPTADMQQDKTFILGGSIIDHRTLSKYWANHDEYKPFTYNYYVNVTFFPWLEVGYSLTLVKGLYNSTYWPEHTWGKFVNQDRSFHGRLRVWKEGWWKTWTPQIVLGANDPGSHTSDGGGEIDLGGGSKGNHNYLTRFFLAATKHVSLNNIGNIGIHASWILNKPMEDVHFNRLALGANLQFELPSENSFFNKALNGLNLMADICPTHDESFSKSVYALNVGGSYSFLKDHISLVAALEKGKYFSGGVQFKVHL